MHVYLDIFFVDGSELVTGTRMVFNLEDAVPDAFEAEVESGVVEALAGKVDKLGETALQETVVDIVLENTLEGKLVREVPVLLQAWPEL